eukprot:6175087-Pleurochrysis_carterae.AAC.1
MAERECSGRWGVCSLVRRTAARMIAAEGGDADACAVRRIVACSAQRAAASKCVVMYARVSGERRGSSRGSDVKHDARACEACDAAEEICRVHQRA